MAQLLHHQTLNATLRGAEIQSDGTAIVQYRGIQYAKIPERFERARMIGDWKGKDFDCTRYGPKCPQNHVDVTHLLRLPEEFETEPEEEDEFACLNLNVTVPRRSTDLEEKKKLPVLIWVHGGSQVVTFTSAASKCCDMTRIVADSVKAENPLIVVYVNYRLNIFAFGDGHTGINNALRDQRCAIDWVNLHIAGFGGDKDAMTLAGESAGAVFVHAHTFTGASVRRAILSSGSLYLSPPQPVSKGQELMGLIGKRVQHSEQKSLKDAPTSALLNALRESNVNTMWLQEESCLGGWQQRSEQIEELIIGDVEYESVLWRNGIETMPVEAIVQAFDNNKQHGPRLRKLYGITTGRPTASKLGALDFINDILFAVPAEDIAGRWRGGKKSVFQYVVDQANPWQASSRAHHAVDLVLLFGGYDLSFNPSAEAVGNEMRKRWIAFVNGEQPWSAGGKFAFGPLGECKEIDGSQFAARRRVDHWKSLREIGSAQLMPILGALAAGRISLHN